MSSKLLHTFNICLVVIILSNLLLNFAMAKGTEQQGAYTEKVSIGAQVMLTWYVAPVSELIILGATDNILKASIDDGSGIIITAITKPEENSNNIAFIISDGQGTTSRFTSSFTQLENGSKTYIAAPTIYSTVDRNNNYKTLGFFGRAHQGSTIYIEITSSINQKIELNTLADSSGEWQTTVPSLSPGKHQAKAKTIFQGIESQWSQLVNVEILSQSDEFLFNLGGGARKSIESVVGKLPEPVQQVTYGLQAQSSIASKYVLPAALTISTLAQSGILLNNLLYLLFQIFNGLAQLLGLRKKRVSSGIVYDALTKKPLGRVIIRLYQAATHRLIETDVTNALGLFTFMPPEGYYYLRAFMPDYIFPSVLISTKRDGKYSQIYTGGEIHVSPLQPVISVAIPIDPRDYQETWQMRIKRIWILWIEPANSWLLWLGFFLAMLSFIRESTKLNFAIFAFYLTSLSYIWWQGRRVKREYGLVVNKQGKPMPNIELTLTETQFNRLVSRRVTDNKGRYQFIVPSGKYQIRLNTPNLELSPQIRGSYKGETITVVEERGHTKHLIPKIVIRPLAASH